MATYILTPQPGLPKSTGIAGRENQRAPKGIPDSKSAIQISGTKQLPAVKAAEQPKDKNKAKPFPLKQLVVLCNSIASMMDAQISLSRALEFYSARLTREDLRNTLKSVAAAVDRGDDNHKAFAATGRFDSTFIGLIKTGTLASNLPAALRAVARRMKTNAEFQGKLRKALLTPCGVLVFQWCLLIYAMTGLIPNVEKMLKDMHVEPDAFSGAVFAFSHVFQATYIPITIGVIAFAVTCWLSISFRNLIAKAIMSRWKLLRRIVMGFRQLTLIGTFEMLISNNIPIADSLETCSRTLKNTPLEKELFEVKSKVALGINLGEAFRKYTSVDPQLSHMIEIGERASNLPEQLRLLRDLYEEETAQQIELFTGLVGLLSKVGTVAIIAGIYLATYLPIIMAGVKMMNSGM
jgi:Type II secretory pathway, component PulF